MFVLFTLEPHPLQFVVPWMNALKSSLTPSPSVSVILYKYPPWPTELSYLSTKWPSTDDGYESNLNQNDIVPFVPSLNSWIFLSGMLTLASTPSKESAPLTLPVVQVGPLVKAPLFTLPEESEATVPEPSSNFQWPTRPVMDFTEKLKEVVFVTPPPVAVMVTGKVPVGVVERVLRVTVVEQVGLQLVGKTDAVVPETRVKVIMLLTEEPWFTEISPELVKEKSKLEITKAGRDERFSAGTMNLEEKAKANNNIRNAPKAIKINFELEKIFIWLWNYYSLSI